MLSDQHAIAVIKRLFIRNNVPSDYAITEIIALNNVLSKTTYSINDISILVKEAFKRKWNTTRDIKNYRSLHFEDARIICYADVNWGRPGSKEEVSDAFIELFPSNGKRLVLNIICQSTGEIRQAHINSYDFK